MAVTPDSELQEIRSLVSNELSATELTDTTIKQSVYLGLAEAKILERVGKTEATFATLTLLEQFKAKVSIKYETAALIIPAVQNILSQQVLDRITRLEEHDWQEKVKAYNDIVDKQTPPPSGTTTRGSIGINIEQTTSRVC